MVRDAKKTRKIVKYGMDQNARTTVKGTAVSEWTEVTSEQQLLDLVANTPPAPASQNRPYNLRRFPWEVRPTDWTCEVDL